MQINNTKCEICDIYTNNMIKLDNGNHHVCFNCFFDKSIPNPTSLMTSDEEKKRLTEERNEAINNRAEVLIKQLRNSK